MMSFVLFCRHRISLGTCARSMFAPFCLLPAVLWGQANWNHAFSSEDAEVFGFDTASFFVPGEEGFVLLGNTANEGSQAVARFDGSGNEIWNALLTAPSALPKSVEIAPDVGNIGQFYARYYTPGDERIHLGLFKGSDFSPVFAQSYPLAADYERVDTAQLSGGEGAVTQVLGDGVQVLVLDGTGSRVFEKKYTGAPFASLGTAQAVSADLQSAPGGYLLMVERTGAIVTDPVTFEQSAPRDLTMVQLDSSGTVTGATSLSVTTRGVLPLLWTVLPSGDLLVGILDFSVDPVTHDANNSMRYVLIDDSLALQWSFQTAGSALFGFRSDEAGTELYLAGTVYLPESSNSETDAVIARLNLASGALTTVQTIDRMAYDTAQIGAVTDDAVYGSITSSELSGTTETTVYRFSRDLSSATALTYSGPQDFGFVSLDAASGNVLLSVTAGDSTRALTLSSSLAPAITCPDLNPATLTLVPGIATEDYAITLTPVSIAGADEATASGSTSFSFTAFSYTATPDGFCVEGADPGETDDAPTFDFSGVSPKLRFPTEAGAIYLINVSTDLTTFIPMSTVFGDGTEKEYSFTAPIAGGLYIEIAPVSFEP